MPIGVATPATGEMAVLTVLTGSAGTATTGWYSNNSPAATASTSSAGTITAIRAGTVTAARARGAEALLRHCAHKQQLYLNCKEV